MRVAASLFALTIVLLPVATGCGGAQTTDPEPRPAIVVEAQPAPRPVAQPSNNAEEDAGNEDGGEGGEDRVAVLGTMWGDSIGDAFGAGGLGLIGIGSSDGGTGDGGGIGLGSIGTIGHGAGTGTGAGYGSGSGRLGRTTSQVQPGETAVVGALDKDVIRRVIRRHMNRFRYCYERQLATDPNLQGKVVVRFVISTTGAVSSARDAGSTLPDESVKACVLRTYQSMQFPAPNGGVVVVTYPIVFHPGGDAADGGTPTP
jgi:TonB family protein